MKKMLIAFCIAITAFTLADARMSRAVLRRKINTELKKETPNFETLDDLLSQATSSRDKRFYSRLIGKKREEVIKRAPAKPSRELKPPKLPPKPQDLDRTLQSTRPAKPPKPAPKLPPKKPAKPIDPQLQINMNLELKNKWETLVASKDQNELNELLEKLKGHDQNLKKWQVSKQRFAQEGKAIQQRLRSASAEFINDISQEQLFGGIRKLLIEQENSLVNKIDQQTTQAINKRHQELKKGMETVWSAKPETTAWQKYAVLEKEIREHESLDNWNTFKQSILNRAKEISNEFEKAHQEILDTIPEDDEYNDVRNRLNAIKKQAAPYTTNAATPLNKQLEERKLYLEGLQPQTQEQQLEKYEQSFNEIKAKMEQQIVQPLSTTPASIDYKEANTRKNQLKAQLKASPKKIFGDDLDMLYRLNPEDKKWNAKIAAFEKNQKELIDRVDKMVTQQYHKEKETKKKNKK